MQVMVSGVMSVLLRLVALPPTAISSVVCGQGIAQLDAVGSSRVECSSLVVLQAVAARTTLQ